MKKHLLLLAIGLATPALAGKNPSDYPMRLQFITVSSQKSPWGISHIGKADLLDGDTSYAVDYSGTCSFTFQSHPVSAHIDVFAKWKDQPRELEALFTHEGQEGKYDKCRFKINNMLPGKAYVGQAGGYKLVDCNRGRNCPAIWGMK